MLPVAERRWPVVHLLRAFPGENGPGREARRVRRFSSDRVYTLHGNEWSPGTISVSIRESSFGPSHSCVGFSAGELYPVWDMRGCDPAPVGRKYPSVVRNRSDVCSRLARIRIADSAR